ncbi:MAG: SAM-dependent methyltransferase, partial [Opitutaceae bacterium]|nr:SAM-dependent methyltransferase [Verrucomicrobiales bacterium]
PQAVVAEPSAASSRAVYFVIALSGLAALGAEVVWTRLLSLLLGATVYTFSIILAVFLVGLGIGSTIGSFLSRSLARPRMALGLCQVLLIPAIAWAAYSITQSLPNWPINPTLSLSPSFTFQLDLALCFWTILPAAILWGASFPLALAAVATRGEDPGRLVGGVYAANTVGAILGALGFSLFFVPMGGTQSAERWLIGISVLSAIVALAPYFRPGPAQNGSGLEGGRSSWKFSVRGVVTVVALLAVASWLASTVIPIPWGLIGYGRFTASYGNRLAKGVWDEKNVPSTGGPPDIFATYVGEGLNGSVAVSLSTVGVRSFHSAGKVQASNGDRDMRLQRLLGHISALTHQKPESVLVVACGAGVTAGTFVLHPDVKRIVICDIEPLVPKFVAPHFAKENYDVVKDPRTELVADDGRHYIRTTKEKFDIITSDPVDPWVKGCAALNTVEYYEMCRDHLKPGGVMSLWLPLYESNSETVKSVIATFFKVFPHGILWSNDTEGEGYDAVLFAQAQPTRIDVESLQSRLDRLDHALVKKSLADVGFTTAVSMLSTYAGQASGLQEWMRDAQINTDANLRLQYLAGLSFNSYVESDILAEITRHYKFPEQLFIGREQPRNLLKIALQGRHPVARNAHTPVSSDQPGK